MPVLREQDFDKLAAEIVDQFLSGQSKLAQAAAKLASDHGLNPDQIERLVQSANTMTFLRMMDQRKQAGAGDLLHEFDPIDSRQVIRIVIDNAGVHVEPMDNGMAGDEMSMGDEMELPDEMHGQTLNPAEGEPGHTDSPEVEQCEEECHKKLDPPGVKTEMKYDQGDKKERPKDDDEDKKPPVKKEAAVMRARKLAGILEDQYKQAEWAFEERFNTLVGRFRRAYNPPSFAEFEKDAMAEFGDETGLHLINSIRQARHLEPLDLPTAREKVAALDDHHVSLESPELHLFEELHEIATKAAELERGLTWVRTQCA